MEMKATKCKRCSTPLDDPDKLFFDYDEGLLLKIRQHEGDYRESVAKLQKIRHQIRGLKQERARLQGRVDDLVRTLQNPGGLFHSLNQQMVQAEFCASVLREMGSER